MSDITLVSKAGIRVQVPDTARGEINRLKACGYIPQPAPAASLEASNAAGSDAPSPAPEPVAYDDQTIAELRDEIDRRNADRDEDDRIDVSSRARHQDLVDALQADDTAHEENE